MEGRPKTSDACSVADIFVIVILHVDLTQVDCNEDSEAGATADLSLIKVIVR